MSARDVLKNLVLNVDGRGYAGQLETYSPPTLTLTTEDFRGGGMDAPVALEMGMEALETSFGLVSYDADVLALYGVVESQNVQLTIRGALVSFDNTVKQVIHRHRGKITSLNPGEWSPGGKPTLGVTLRNTYYYCEIAGRPIHEIDIPNMARMIDGEDRLAAERQALGV